MIPRKRGKRPQKGNPHKLTLNQHVTPAATLRRFAGPDGLVEVHLRDGRIRKLPIDNQIFCVERLWDQRAEAGYMKSIEDKFQALVSTLDGGRSTSLTPEEHVAITRYWSLLRWRNYFIDSPMEAPQLNGIHGETLSIDIQEILESHWTSYVDQDNKIPAHIFVGLVIQTHIVKDEVALPNQRWGVLRTSAPQLLLPDRMGPVTSVVASPRLLLSAGDPDGRLTESEVWNANRIMCGLSRNFVVGPPR